MRLFKVGGKQHSVFFLFRHHRKRKLQWQRETGHHIHTSDDNEEEENAPPHSHSKTSVYRNVTKPALERRRRARINRCLEEMREVLLLNKDLRSSSSPSSVCKMEKADVMEMALEQLKRSVKEGEERKRRGGENSAVAFNSGYQACMGEVQR